jgi:hypothetical protein
VNDLACIKGWFLVPGHKLLSDSDLANAKTALEAAAQQRTAAKPRRKPK